MFNLNISARKLSLKFHIPLIDISIVNNLEKKKNIRNEYKDNEIKSIS